MNLPQAILRPWRNLGITAKFGVAFALLLGMILLEGVVSLLALSAVHHAEAVILGSVEIRQRVFEMDGELEKARRLHRDFFLQYPSIGFTSAQELYFKPSNEVIAHVVRLSEELKSLIESTHVSESLRERDTDLTLYLTTAQRFAESFRELVALVTELAAPGTGLEDQLAAVETRLEPLAHTSTSALLPFREMQAHQRNYLATRKRPAMQAALNAAFDLDRALAASSLAPAARTEAARLIKQYMEIAGKIPDLDVAIRGKLNDFSLQSNAVDPISRSLKALAQAEVERARTRIALLGRLSRLVILATLATGLAFSFVVAAIIHASVTRKIVALTHSAEQLRAGSLAACVETGGTDEVGVLAASFNDMTSRMQDMVANLEAKVEERTADLTATRDQLQQLVVQLDEKNHALEILSVTDRLTGLNNRRRLETALQSELLRFRRYGKPFSVVLLDIDHFKAVNDTFGHSVGDTVLVQIAALLSRGARETDIVGRWGGEEFLLVCPETPLTVATALAERIRREFESQTFAHVGSVTASFGVSASREADESEILLLRADQALYRAKDSGRNRVETSA